jgi:hypothetical protein
MSNQFHNPDVFNNYGQVLTHIFRPVEGHAVCGDCGAARGATYGSTKNRIHPPASGPGPQSVASLLRF